ncbi:MAG: hypothetical protein J6P16_01135 [Eubacterium sp.]|nr:hypothetical protein [Eubacterium sp.]
MSDERSLIVGLDLGNEVSQLAVYDRELMEPVLMGQSEDNPDALIDTIVSFEGRDDISGFLDSLRDGSRIRMGAKKVDPERVVAYFFKKTLALTRGRYPGEKIKMLVITVPEMNKDFVDRLYEALSLIGLESDRVKIIDHKRSYMYYVLYQRKELWTNDVGLFDYDGENLIYEQLKIDRTHTPSLVGVSERNLTETFAREIDAAAGAMPQNMSEAVTDEEELYLSKKGAVFENLVRGVLRSQYISSLFMTGDGFETEWADAVFPRLAVGRRLFRGRNLYVSGAVYAAREFSGGNRLDDYLIFAPDMVPASLSIDVYSGGHTEELLIARAGEPWFEVDTSFDLIPDGDTEIPVNIKPAFDGEAKTVMLDITPVAGKADRMTRLEIRTRFESRDTAIFTICDKGFGETMPGTDRVWEEAVKCS